MKKRFFYSHPILGGLIALILVTVICNAIGGVAQLGAAIADMSSAVHAGELAVNTDDMDKTIEILETYLDKEPMANANNIAVALSALLCIFLYLKRTASYDLAGSF